MNELESLIKLGEAHYRQNCPLKKGDDHPIDCICGRAGVIWAYRQFFIPSGYGDFTFDHFDGDNRGNQREKILSSDVLLKAKQALVRYCFKNVESLEYDEKEWLDKSIMDERRNLGHSLVIYGNPYKIISVPASSSSGKPEPKAVKKKIGRTFMASLVMREAINLKWRPGHDGDSYCYERYDQLVQRLMKQADGDKGYDQEINVYKDADWLVIDEISLRKESDATKRYRTSVLNSLFGERIAAGLPNILVFQDDISKIANDLEQEFGSFIADIIRNKKTHKIALIEETEKRQK